MSTQETKADRERRVFKSFAQQSNLEINLKSIQSGDPNKQEPDILVEHGGTQIGFELTELCDEQIAKSTALADERVFWTSDPTRSILRNKLRKKYTPQIKTSLLIYWDGRTVTPDDVAVPTLEHEVRNQRIANFESIWYMGEECVTKIYPADA